MATLVTENCKSLFPIRHVRKPNIAPHSDRVLLFLLCCAVVPVRGATFTNDYTTNTIDTSQNLGDGIAIAAGIIFFVSAVVAILDACLTQPPATGSIDGAKDHLHSTVNSERLEVSKPMSLSLELAVTRARAVIRTAAACSATTAAVTILSQLQFVHFTGVLFADLPYLSFASSFSWSNGLLRSPFSSYAGGRIEFPGRLVHGAGCSTQSSDVQSLFVGNIFFTVLTLFLASLIRTLSAGTTSYLRHGRVHEGWTTHVAAASPTWMAHLLLDSPRCQTLVRTQEIALRFPTWEGFTIVSLLSGACIAAGRSAGSDCDGWVASGTMLWLLGPCTLSLVLLHRASRSFGLRMARVDAAMVYHNDGVTHSSWPHIRQTFWKCPGSWTERLRLRLALCEALRWKGRWIESPPKSPPTHNVDVTTAPAAEKGPTPKSNSSDLCSDDALCATINPLTFLFGRVALPTLAEYTEGWPDNDGEPTPWYLLTVTLCSCAKGVTFTCFAAVRLVVCAFIAGCMPIVASTWISCLVYMFELAVVVAARPYRGRVHNILEGTALLGRVVVLLTAAIASVGGSSDVAVRNTLLGVNSFVTVMLTVVESGPVVYLVALALVSLLVTLGACAPIALSLHDHDTVAATTALATIREMTAATAAIITGGTTDRDERATVVKTVGSNHVVAEQDDDETAADSGGRLEAALFVIPEENDDAINGILPHGHAGDGDSGADDDDGGSALCLGGSLPVEPLFRRQLQLQLQGNGETMHGDGDGDRDMDKDREFVSTVPVPVTVGVGCLVDAVDEIGRPLWVSGRGLALTSTDPPPPSVDTLREESKQAQAANDAMPASTAVSSVDTADDGVGVARTNVAIATAAPNLSEVIGAADAFNVPPTTIVDSMPQDVAAQVAAGQTEATAWSLVMEMTEEAAHLLDPNRTSPTTQTASASAPAPTPAPVPAVWSPSSDTSTHAVISTKVSSTHPSVETLKDMPQDCDGDTDTATTDTNTNNTIPMTTTVGNSNIKAEQPPSPSTLPQPADAEVSPPALVWGLASQWSPASGSGLEADVDAVWFGFSPSSDGDDSDNTGLFTGHKATKRDSLPDVSVPPQSSSSFSGRSSDGLAATAAAAKASVAATAATATMAKIAVLRMPQTQSPQMDRSVIRSGPNVSTVTPSPHQNHVSFHGVIQKAASPPRVLRPPTIGPWGSLTSSTHTNDVSPQPQQQQQVVPMPAVVPPSSRDVAHTYAKTNIHADDGNADSSEDENTAVVASRAGWEPYIPLVENNSLGLIVVSNDGEIVRDKEVRDIVNDAVDQDHHVESNDLSTTDGPIAKLTTTATTTTKTATKNTKPTTTAPKTNATNESSQSSDKPSAVAWTASTPVRIQRQPLSNPFKPLSTSTRGNKDDDGQAQPPSRTVPVASSGSNSDSVNVERDTAVPRRRATWLRDTETIRGVHYNKGKGRSDQNPQSPDVVAMSADILLVAPGTFWT